MSKWSRSMADVQTGGRPGFCQWLSKYVEVSHSFSLTQKEAFLFGRSWICTCCPILFALIRTGMLVLILEIIVESFLWELNYNNNEWWYFFLFLSYWSLIIQALYLLLAVILTWKSSVGTKYDAYGPMEIFTTPRRGRKSLHPFVIIIWILQNVSSTMSLATALMYWTAYPVIIIVCGFVQHCSSNSVHRIML